MEKEEKLEEVVETKEEVNFEDKITELEKKLEEEEKRYLRLSADFQNFSKRKEQELKNKILYASQSIIEKILPTYENLERALKVFEETNDIESNSLYQGVEMTFKNLKYILEQEGLEILNPLGEIYDPNLSEAVGVANDSEKENEEIVAVYSKGYRLNGKLIQTAKVQVNKK